jgi:chemotaxis response regulator CheB
MTLELRHKHGTEHDISRDVILMGASAGGIQAIGQVLAELPADLRAAVAVTLHRGSHRSELASVFRARSKLDVVEAQDGERSPRDACTSPRPIST